MQIKEKLRIFKKNHKNKKNQIIFTKINIQNNIIIDTRVSLGNITINKIDSQEQYKEKLLLLKKQGL